MRPLDIKICCGLTLVLLSGGCASWKRAPFPEEQQTLGSLEGYESEIRIWGDRSENKYDISAPLVKSQVMAHDASQFKNPQSFLALSGGGQNGAFGAGLLNGWSESGSRPEFRIVSGISTGAIIAPFAFLGSSHDAGLKEMFTLYSTKQVLKKKVLKGLFGGVALTESDRLLKLIAHYVDDEMVEAIAVEYAKGRRLFIGTTNLDAKRPVVWDIGRIASSDAPDKVELIHRIILASASVPAAFPPVLFQASKEETEYYELHVDGGISYQLFINPSSVQLGEYIKAAGFTAGGTVYVIRNSLMNSSWEPVKKNAAAISAASVGGLTMNQGNSDQYVIYQQAKLDGMKFQCARIPDVFTVEPNEAFDTAYMQALFEMARNMAVKGYPWSDEPL